MEIALECHKRPEKINPRALRREGLIPAVLYGHQGTESVSLVLKEKEAQNLLKQAAVNSTLIDLKVPEMPWQGQVLLREVQSHPWKRTLYHFSFFSVAAHGKIEVSIPVHIEGEENCVGIKTDAGIVEHILTEVRLQCLPGNIPDAIAVDISNLHVGQSFPVKDLTLPDGVTALEEPEQGVVAILSPGKG